MPARFRRTRHGIVARFGRLEAEVLRVHLAQVAELLGGSAALAAADDPLLLAGEVAPADPALARLLPDAYRDDPGAAGEFRRFTEGELRAEKVADALAALGELGADGPAEVVLDPAGAERWLRALNDVRLVLGVRLDVSEDPDADLARLPDGSLLRVAYSHYHWLGWLQETLLDGLGDPAA